jgi:hypothetical protein
MRNEYRNGNKRPIRKEGVFGGYIQYDMESVFDNWQIWLKGLSQ